MTFRRPPRARSGSATWKWRALDPLETVLMVLCGILLFGFCTTVIFDIVTRELRHPWLWLQEVTSTLFIYAIFTGTAVATRRNDHLYLTAVGDNLHGSHPHRSSRTQPAPSCSRLRCASSISVT